MVDERWRVDGGDRSYGGRSRNKQGGNIGDEIGGKQGGRGKIRRDPDDTVRHRVLDAGSGAGRDNVFNNLSRLSMLWTVLHRCPTGARFAFNCYKYWAQILLRQPGEPPFTLLIRENVNQ